MTASTYSSQPARRVVGVLAAISPMAALLAAVLGAAVSLRSPDGVARSTIYRTIQRAAARPPR
ncbi:hypothetical protein NG819_06105 [Pseudarthrobacter sp. Fe7]|nr:hypothetical protein NG819_06105 [Pseudarthrobacter sp. Fe7]